MKIHTETITTGDLYRLAPAGIYVEVTRHGSRSRDHAFKVGLAAEHGTDAHGIKRAYARNTGEYGGAGDYDRAATYIEWGDWMVALFKVDPRAIIGPYDGPDSFIEQTTQYAPHRPKRENAVAHAERWANELSAVHA